MIYGFYYLEVVVVVQLPSHVWLFSTPWIEACQASLFLTWNLPKITSIASVMPSSHLILWCPLLLLPSVFPRVRDFSSESAVCIRWPEYWSFSSSISPSNEYSGLISLKIDLVWSPSCPGDSQESSLAPEFEFINSLALCLLHSPVLTTVCDHWEDHSLDYMGLCQQSNVSFSIHCLGLS